VRFVFWLYVVTIGLGIAAAFVVDFARVAP
jgi:hypothetical protein